MAGDEYAPAVSGSLKLKGSKPSGIDKKRKKRTKPKAEPPSEAEKTAIQEALEEDDVELRKDFARKQRREDMARSDKTIIAEKEMGRALSEEGKARIQREDDEEFGKHKTEAERKMEETRRKRLIERLEKEGIKTHKERVEELNTYLSRLSEHHDMPRIGPG